jgi:hypothetical protein
MHRHPNARPTQKSRLRLVPRQLQHNLNLRNIGRLIAGSLHAVIRALGR